jgi:hypothetical protein
MILHREGGLVVSSEVGGGWRWAWRGARVGGPAEEYYGKMRTCRGSSCSSQGGMSCTAALWGGGGARLRPSPMSFGHKGVKYICHQVSRPRRRMLREEKGSALPPGKHEGSILSHAGQLPESRLGKEMDWRRRWMNLPWEPSLLVRQSVFPAGAKLPVGQGRAAALP